MFTIRCTTCEARLGVKDETLIGQILACPKCGSMVLVAPPNEEKKSEPREPELIHEPSEPESVVPNSLTAAPVPPSLPEAGPSDSELRLRKFLFGVLAGFVVFLIFGVGILIVRGRQEEPGPVVPVPEIAVPVPEVAVPLPQPVVPGPQVPAPTPALVPVPAVPQPIEKPDEPSPVESAEVPGPQVEEKALAPQVEEKVREEAKKPEAEIRTTTDLLADMERKLPGLVQPAAALAIDVPARLRLPLHGLKLDKVSLVGVVRMLSRLTEVPITLDVDEFRCRGIDIDAPISGAYAPGTAGETLIAVLTPLKLEPVIEDRQVLVTVPQAERDKLSEMPFDVSDLVNGTQDAVDLRGKVDPEGILSPERLAELIRRLIDPVGFSIEEKGPDQPSLKIDGMTLVVKHRRRMLDETLRLLEQFRVLRNLPQKTKIVGELLVPEVFGWDAVQAPLTMNYYQPIQLSEVFPQLEAAAKIRILVDHKALNRALSPFSSLKGTVRSDRGTVDTALEKLLASVDTASLTYRIVGADALEVTTRDVAGQPNKMSIEVHRFETSEQPLPDGETPEELVRTIRTALERGSWNDAGNSETLGLGDIVIDKPSGCLIVRQGQQVQRLLRLWLGKKQSPAQ